MKHPERPFGVVVWGDAHSSEDEAKETDIQHRPWPVKTYGWILRSDEVGVTLASEWLEGGTWRGRTFIPREMVREEIVLRLSTPRRRAVQGATAAVQ